MGWLDKSYLDEQFDKINNLDIDKRKNAVMAKDLAVDGFVYLERIYTLMPYKDFNEIEKTIKRYMDLIDDYTKK